MLCLKSLVWTPGQVVLIPHTRAGFFCGEPWSIHIVRYCPLEPPYTDYTSAAREEAMSETHASYATSMALQRGCRQGRKTASRSCLKPGSSVRWDDRVEMPVSLHVITRVHAGVIQGSLSTLTRSSEIAAPVRTGSRSPKEAVVQS